MDIKEYLESRCVIYKEGEAYWGKGDAHFYVHTRSTSKLFQVLPLYFLNLQKEYELSDEEMVFMSSSHFSMPIHIRTLQSILKKTGISIKQVCLKESAPLGRLSYQEWASLKKEKSKIYHPCIGNHLAVMLLERHLSGSTEGYLNPNGAAQRCIGEIVASFFKIPYEDLQVHEDNCGMTNYYVPADQLALAYAGYGLQSDDDDPIAKAAYQHRININNHPIQLEGDGCLSTILSSRDNMIAKTGTGGLLAISARKGSLPWIFEDCGIVLKSRDGSWDMVIRDVERILHDDPGSHG